MDSERIKDIGVSLMVMRHVAVLVAAGYLLAQSGRKGINKLSTGKVPTGWIWAVAGGGIGWMARQGFKDPVAGAWVACAGLAAMIVSLSVSGNMTPKEVPKRLSSNLNPRGIIMAAKPRKKSYPSHGWNNFRRKLPYCVNSVREECEISHQLEENSWFESIPYDSIPLGGEQECQSEEEAVSEEERCPGLVSTLIERDDVQQGKDFDQQGKNADQIIMKSKLCESKNAVSSISDLHRPVVHKINNRHVRRRRQHEKSENGVLFEDRDRSRVRAMGAAERENSPPDRFPPHPIDTTPILVTLDSSLNDPKPSSGETMASPPMQNKDVSTPPRKTLTNKVSTPRAPTLARYTCLTAGSRRMTRDLVLKRNSAARKEMSLKMKTDDDASMQYVQTNDDEFLRDRLVDHAYKKVPEYATNRRDDELRKELPILRNPALWYSDLTTDEEITEEVDSSEDGGPLSTLTSTPPQEQCINQHDYDDCNRLQNSYVNPAAFFKRPERSSYRNNRVCNFLVAFNPNIIRVVMYVLMFFLLCSVAPSLTKYGPWLDRATSTLHSGEIYKNQWDGSSSRDTVLNSPWKAVVEEPLPSWNEYESLDLDIC